MRTKVIVCNELNTESEIKEKMLQFRTEFMPILNVNTQLIKVYFWNDFFETEKKITQLQFSIPVVIMAGGFGTRLKPLTYVIPKPLIPIGEKTIIEVIIDKFLEIGAKEFYFTVNYKSELIKYYFEQIENKPYQVNYLLEEKPLGTAGSLFLLKDKINTTFFVTNCDIIIDEDYVQIYNYHIENKNDITLVASLKHIKIPYGTVESGMHGELLQLKEKPEVVFMINTGMYILEPHVLNYIKDNEHIHITELIEIVKQHEGRVGVFPVSEKSWQDIGEWKEYEKIIEKYK